jgi:hypothetical protein
LPICARYRRSSDGVWRKTRQSRLQDGHEALRIVGADGLEAPQRVDTCKQSLPRDTNLRRTGWFSPRRPDGKHYSRYSRSTRRIQTCRDRRRALHGLAGDWRAGSAVRGSSRAFRGRKTLFAIKSVSSASRFPDPCRRCLGPPCGHGYRNGHHPIVANFRFGNARTFDRDRTN